MKSNAIGWLLLIIQNAATLVGPVRCAPIVNLNLHHSNDVFKPITTTSTVTTIDQVVTNEPTKKFANRFIILTNGNQIKLYPLKPKDHDNPQAQLMPTGGHYLLKSAELNATDIIDRLGDNSYSRWLLERRSRTSRPLGASGRLELEIPRQSPGKRNIVKQTNEDDEDEEMFKTETGWNKPWISDVDYFFDASFCERSSASSSPFQLTDSCLIIVWLDKANKFIRFGSVDLQDKPIELLPLDPASSSANHVIWLNEFPPIDLCGLASNFDSQLMQCDVSNLVVDKSRAKLHVVLSRTNSHYGPHESRVLSGSFRSSRTTDDNSLHPLDELNVFAFDDCSADNSSLPGHNGLKNLQVDESNGNWLFLFNKQGGGKITAVNLSDMRQKPYSKLDGLPLATQAIVKDTLTIKDLSSSKRLVEFKFPWMSLNDADDEMETLHKAQAMVMDSKKRQLYWITDNNQLFASDLAGENARLVGQLSAKPAIRSPESMQVYQDTILISDLSKNSIMAYKLPTGEGLQGSGDNILPATHRVLLVEWPTVYGFRLIDLDDALQSKLEEHVGLVQQQIQLSWFDMFFAGLESVFSCPVGYSDEYDQLLDRAEANLRCHVNIEATSIPCFFNTYTFIFIVIQLLVFLWIVCLYLKERFMPSEIKHVKMEQDSTTKNIGPVKYPIV